MCSETIGGVARLGWIAAATGLLATAVPAQDVTPRAINIVDGAICTPDDQGEPDSDLREVCITLPPDTTSTKVDIFLLFDDTGSFQDDIPELVDDFDQIVADLEAALPGVDLGFGVGRYEEYGGPGRDYSDAGGFSIEIEEGRPFILNQAILGTDAPTFMADIAAALNAAAPGFGGDFPETAIEGLWQVATGNGFDGNGDGDNTDSGAAGAAGTQTAPGNSGDVPDFASYVGSGDGTLGGVGWRDDSLRLVLLAADNCPVVAFSGGVLPANVTGTGSTENLIDFACFDTVIPNNDQRFGFVGDAKSKAGNTVVGGVVPDGGATIQETVDALNGLGIQVIGLFADSAGPGNPEPAETFLSAIARLTGAVDMMGDPLVFDIGGGAMDIADAIVEAVEDATTQPIDIKLVAEGNDPCIMIDIVPPVHFGVLPDETVCFDVFFSGDECDGDNFELVFRDNDSNAALGDVPVRLTCEPPMDECITVTFDEDSIGPLVNGQVPMFTGMPFALSSGGVNEGAAIFDTDVGGPNDPGADADLLVDQGNALILQENPGQMVPGIFDEPDDNNWGGWHLFEFPEPSLLESVDLIDICNDWDPPQDARVILVDDQGRERKYIVPPGFTSDVTVAGTGVETLDLTSNGPQMGFEADTSVVEDAGFDQNSTIAMLVIFKGSAALDNLRICPPDDGGQGQGGGPKIGNGPARGTPTPIGMGFKQAPNNR